MSALQTKDSQDYIRAEPLALSTAQKIVHFGQEDQSISTRAPSTTSTSETLWKQSPKSLPRFYSAGSNLVRSDRSRSDPKILLSVGRFLRKNGFRDINSKKSSFGGLFCTYPLHVAAEQNETWERDAEWDQRMVSMLLHLGANPNQKDGRGRSPDECVKNKKTHVEVHNGAQPKKPDVLACSEELIPAEAHVLLHLLLLRATGLLGHDALRPMCHTMLEALESSGIQGPSHKVHESGYRGRQLPKEAHTVAKVLVRLGGYHAPEPLRRPWIYRTGGSLRSTFVTTFILEPGRGRTSTRRISEPKMFAFLSLAEVVSQLRNCRLRTVVKHFGKLTHALQEVQQRFDERAEVAVYRMGSGWRRMESHLHTCSSFLSASVTGCPEVEMILAFLDARHVTSLSASFASAYRHCWADAKLRAPNLKVASVRSATHRILPSAAKTLLVDPNLGSPVSRGISGLDVIAFSKWLQKARSMKEITMSLVLIA
eukprot:g22088.t1